MQVTIYKGTTPVAKSDNLRGILTYARKHGLRRVQIRNIVGAERPGHLYVEFADGAYVRTDFADYRVLERWVLTRRSWFAYGLVQGDHWPDSRSWYVPAWVTQ